MISHFNIVLCSCLRGFWTVGDLKLNVWISTSSRKLYLLPFVKQLDDNPYHHRKQSFLSLMLPCFWLLLNVCAIVQVREPDLCCEGVCGFIYYCLFPPMPAVISSRISVNCHPVTGRLHVGRCAPLPLPSTGSLLDPLILQKNPCLASSLGHLSPHHRAQATTSGPA